MDAKTWAIVISGLIGGLGLFLYGMSLMSEGLQKTAGNRLKVILEKLTSNRFIGALVGALVTVLIQSSSATTVMVVGFVNAGMMNLTQALSVVLGANIGTTVTAQILAFKITALALPAIGIGAIMMIFIKKSALQYIGQIILGFGMLFLGMQIMTSAFTPLNESEGFRSLFVMFGNYPVLAVMVGALTTLLVQSSSATIGITIALATTGLVDFPTATALVLGDNIGTTVTANLAAIGGSRTAKQAAFGHFLFNFFGVCYMLILLHPFMSLVNFLTPGEVTYMAADGTYPYMARHIANVHTLFNIINALIFLPLIPLLAKLCEKLIKSDQEQAYHYTRLSNAMAGTPEIATSQARSEVGRMASVTLSMMKTAAKAIQKRDRSKVTKISDYEETLDGYKKELNQFLDLIQTRPLSKQAVFSIESMRQAINALEEVGDQTLKLISIWNKMGDKKQELSDSALKEFNDMFDAVLFFASVTFSAFAADRPQSEEELALEDEIDAMHKQFRKNHIKRLNKGFCSIDIGVVFVDMLKCLEKMGDYIFTIAQNNFYDEEAAK